MSEAPGTVRVSDRLTPLSGIAAVNDRGLITESRDGRARSAWRRFWTIEDPVLRDAGRKGEWAIARFRLLAAMVLFVLPLRAVMEQPTWTENYVGLAISGAGVAAGIAICWMIATDVAPTWIGFIASVLDVTWVSTGLAAFIVLDLPQIASNSRVVFEAYFICIAATCLRYDRRVCVVAGVLAMLQYTAIAAWAGTTVGTHPGWADGSYGRFDPYDQVARVLLLGVATMVALATVLRVQQLRVLSVRDRLTGLVVRGYFDEQLTEAFKRAKKKSEALAVAMIDLDYFKAFNDRYGHAVGDLVLAEVARAVRGLVRAEDVVGRYGGEELIIMLPGLSRERAVERMERIREAIGGVQVEVDASAVALGVDDDARLGVSPLDRPSLTASIGLASWPEDRCTAVEDLVFRADARLFHAKRSGRNRTVSRSGATDEILVPTLR
jgi:diguanylate cyclase (GGDEF)-like protein